MTTEADKFWLSLARRVRGSEEKVMRPDESDTLLRELPPDEVSSSEEDDIVAAVLAGVSLRDRRSRIAPMLEDASAGQLAEEHSRLEADVLQLNRNKGRDLEDPEAERLAEQLRKEALGEGSPPEPDEDEGEPRDR